MLAGIVATFNGVLGSSLPAGDTQSLANHFGISSPTQLVLPLTAYQFGFVVGSLFLTPLSELYGRRIIFIATLGLYALFTLASALAPSWSALIFFRWVCGVGASSTISVTGGLNADLFYTPLARGRANALFLAVSEYKHYYQPMRLIF